MFSSNLRYFLYGIVLTASLGSLAVQAAGPDGIFGDYFQNMIRDASSCGTNTVITGFDTTAGPSFGTQECTPFNNLVKTVLKTFGSAPAGQAVVGYDPATGNPIFGDVNWVRSGANISYTPGNVGIGTASPTQALDVAGNARVSGNVGIGTASPAYTLDVNGNVINNGWYRSRGDTGIYNETHGGGIYMTDSTWVRTYNAKSFWTNSFLGSNAGLTVGYGGTSSPAGGAIIAGNVGIGTSSPATTLQVNGNIQAAGSPVPSNWYNLQAGSIGASTVYGYNGICTGNASGICNGAGGVVLSPAGSIGIGGQTQSTSWGITVLKDSWAMVARPSSGGDNSQAQSPVGSIYANDMYFRSVGSWASQMATKSYVDSKVNSVGNAPCNNTLYGNLISGQVFIRHNNYGTCGTCAKTVVQCLNGSIVTLGDLECSDCAGTCFPKGTPVLMASGEYKSIEDIKAGEKVTGMNGSINTVRGLWRPKLGDRTLYRVNDTFSTTGDHMILSERNNTPTWGSIDPTLNISRRYNKPASVTGKNGEKITIMNSAIPASDIVKLDVGSQLLDYRNTLVPLTSLTTHKDTTPDTQLYTLYTDNTESFVLEGGYVVDGMPQGALPKSSNK